MQAVEVAYQALLQVRRELESVQRLSELTSAAAKFGLDKVDIANRSERVAKRAETLQQACMTFCWTASPPKIYHCWVGRCPLYLQFHSRQVYLTTVLTHMAEILLRQTLLHLAQYSALLHI